MWDRVNKNKCRKLVIGFACRPSLAGRPKPAKAVLMLPSSEARCVHEAVRQGLITSSTKCVFVEMDPFRFEMMRDEVERLGLNATCLLKPLDQVGEDITYDYVYLDLNGAITKEIGQWITTYLRDHLSRSARVAITVHSCYRNSPFAKASEDFFFRRKDYMIRLSHDFYLDNARMLTYLATIFHLFGNCGYSVYIVQHRDTHKMWTFMLTPTIHPPKYGTLAEEFMEFLFAEENVMSVKRQLSKCSQAAHKAWSTRRANAAAKKRSEAAHKAWVTRRQKATA